ncbi:hypothetical protein KIN20_015138 [Parelaphostrongylus tenuis]|uniref:Uncharacterized protein n=1 Tax=Parelaphostrongylus tenuis TaxID=148309 RepID=A0AAD5MJ32_PARTN|nr:hypothetical protein KIN20_015138 [Parelaphostrongylus tenuis]
MDDNMRFTSHEQPNVQHSRWEILSPSFTKLDHTALSNATRLDVSRQPLRRRKRRRRTVDMRKDSNLAKAHIKD